MYLTHSSRGSKPLCIQQLSSGENLLACGTVLWQIPSWWSVWGKNFPSPNRKPEWFQGQVYTYSRVLFWELLRVSHLGSALKDPPHLQHHCTKDQAPNTQDHGVRISTTINPQPQAHSAAHLGLVVGLLQWSGFWWLPTSSPWMTILLWAHSLIYLLFRARPETGGMSRGSLAF